MQLREFRVREREGEIDRDAHEHARGSKRTHVFDNWVNISRYPPGKRNAAESTVQRRVVSEVAPEEQ